MLCFEVRREKRVERSRGEESSGEESRGMVILHLIWMFLKLSRGGGIISIFIVCNFVNMVRVNLVIHLVKYFYALLSLRISLT